MRERERSAPQHTTLDLSMAITESETSHTGWVQFYQRNLSHQPAGGDGSSRDGGIVFGRASPMTESTVVTTTTTTSASPAGPGGSDRMPPATEGRVGKAARRRSRASRKAPTRILNTDTTNFRAMVQKFTGVPSRSFPAGYPHMPSECDAGAGGPAALSFDLAGGSAQLHQQPVVFPFGLQQQQYQQYPQFQQHHERPMFTLAASGGDGSISGSSSGGGVYLRGFGGNPSQTDDMEARESLLLDNISSSQIMPRPAPSNSSSTTDGFPL